MWVDGIDYRRPVATVEVAFFLHVAKELQRDAFGVKHPANELQVVGGEKVHGKPIDC